MKAIVISIRPEFVAKIISGEKKFEFRTRVAKQDIDKLIIYCTYPKQKIVAEVEIEGVLSLPKEKLWKKTHKYSGTSKAYFMDYFKNSDMAYAYKLGKVTLFNTAKELGDYGIVYAPQSFVYARY